MNPLRFFMSRRQRVPQSTVTLALVALLLSPLPADTVFLKDGTQILDCKVTQETATQVHVDTPVGKMVVPKTEVFRILKVKTAHDNYDEQLAKLREGDVNGLYKLAVWCRTSGLRKESDELLARVISLKDDHPEARRLLGHLKLGGEWVVPPPLTIRFKASGANAGDIRKALDLFLEMRRDVRLASDSTAKTEGGAALDTCNLDASLIIVRKAAGTFYGMQVGEPTFGASVRLEAKASWIPKSPPMKTAAEGQVPGNGGNAGLAVGNAFGSSSAVLHRFFDGLSDARGKKIREAFAKEEREKKKGAVKVAAKVAAKT
jgi:hypothetical protein